jgi:TorA maturation chaperone TorD
MGGRWDATRSVPALGTRIALLPPCNEIGCTDAMFCTQKAERWHRLFGVLVKHSESLPVMAPLPLAPEEQGRADFYGLIAHLLLKADAALLSSLVNADGLASPQADNPLDAAWEKLILVAGVMGADAIRDEFDALFVSAGTPQLNPYESFYLTGFMMEKPLAALRFDLGRLGLARAPHASELEDHLGALCETMRLLIKDGHSLVCQCEFFRKHISSWYPRLVEDVRRSPEANFYRQAADFIEAFFDLEAQAFEIEDSRQAARVWPGACKAEEKRHAS